MTDIKQQKSFLFGPECLPSKCYIELIRALNLTIAWSDWNNTLLLLKVDNLNITWIYKVDIGTGAIMITLTVAV